MRKKCDKCERESIVYQVVEKNETLYLCSKCFGEIKKQKQQTPKASIYRPDIYIADERLKEINSQIKMEDIAVFAKAKKIFLKEMKAFMQGQQTLLFICGNPGTGKTTLCKIAASACAASKKPPFYFDWIIGFNKLLTDGWDQLISSIKKSGMVILDDVSYLPNTPAVNKALLAIINTCIENEISLVITTTFRPEEFKERVEPSIVDRLRLFTGIQLWTKSLRRK
jgi:DNA replication protein DnaC